MAYRFISRLRSSNRPSMQKYSANVIFMHPSAHTWCFCSQAIWHTHAFVLTRRQNLLNKKYQMTNLICATNCANATTVKEIQEPLLAQKFHSFTHSTVHSINHDCHLNGIFQFHFWLFLQLSVFHFCRKCDDDKVADDRKNDSWATDSNFHEIVLKRWFTYSCSTSRKWWRKPVENG